MSGFTSSAASSLTALTEHYRSITHNLANATTPGFKRRRTSFEEVLGTASAQTSEDAGGEAQLVSSQTMDFSQGVMTQTGSRLDLALEGRGFFRLEGSPEGVLYTRNGKFAVDVNRQLVDVGGRIVSGQNGQITLPPTVGPADLQVSTDGTLSIAGQALGKLRIVDFEDPSALVPVGENCFRASADAEKPAEDARVRQGYVESSNVSVVEELVGLITVTRLYEANLKSIHVQDEQMKNILQVAMG